MNNGMLSFNHNGVFDSILEMFHRLIDDADDEMLLQMSSTRSENIYLSVPSFLHGMIEQAMMYKHGFGFGVGEMGKLLTFRGIKIIPSIDLAITLFHKDYPLYKNHWMIRKIPLNPPHSQEKEWYTEYVINLKQLPFLSDKDRDHSMN